MKKALVWKEDYQGRLANQIERIGEASEIDSWTHHLKSKMVVIEVPEELENLESFYLEPYIVDAVEAVEAQPEHWSNGSDKVYSADDIPTLVDEEGNPYLDPAYQHVDAVEAVEAKESYLSLRKKPEADQMLRENKINQLRAKRAPLLTEADVKINIAEDDGEDASAWRVYRKELRNITEEYKKVDGNWKVAVDSLDVESFEFPAKPSL